MSDGSKTKIALIQMQCGVDPAANMARAVAQPELREEGTMLAVGRSGLHARDEGSPEPGGGRRINRSGEDGPPEA